MVERQRGGCLTAFLILMLVVNPLTGLYYLFAGSSLSQSLPSLPGWAVPALGVLALVNFVFALAIWNWKKWGVYGFAASSAIVFVINLISLGLLPALTGLVGLGLLAYLLRGVWQFME
jgi:hypothetical protein